MSTIFSAAGPQHQPDEEPLSKIIALLNERFGTSWTPQDRVFYDVVADKLAGQPDIQQAAAVNTAENFKIVLIKAFIDQVIAQMATVRGHGAQAHRRQRHAGRRGRCLPARSSRARHESPGRSTAPSANCSARTRKAAPWSTRRRCAPRQTPARCTSRWRQPALKTIAAFANSRDGGTLLIGVADDGTACGLATDYASLHQAGKDDRDLFQLHLMNIVSAAMGGAAAARVSVQFHTVDGADVCRVHVQPSPVPVEAT